MTPERAATGRAEPIRKDMPMYQNITKGVNDACAGVSAAAQTLAFRGEKKLRERMEAADTVEYVLMAAIFCLGITAVAFALRGQIKDIFTGIANSLNATKAGGSDATFN